MARSESAAPSACRCGSLHPGALDGLCYECRVERGWIQTASGGRFWPLAPHMAPIRIEDVADALSNLCRFTGHCRRFYSVAQHSVLVAGHLPERLQMAGLLHDASEAFLGDMSSPLKASMPAYREAERCLMVYVGQSFGVPDSLFSDPLLKAADLRALATERRDLMRPAPAPWTQVEGVEPWGIKLKPWSPARSAAAFLRMFHVLRTREVSR